MVPGAVAHCVARLLALAVVFCHVSPAPAQSSGDAYYPKGIDGKTKAAIDRGLAYLSRTQARDGSWSNRSQYGAYPVAMTALGGVAMLMDGNTATQGRYAANVERALNFLLRSTSTSGLIVRPEHEGRPMYGHGFSLLFLSQLYGMTADVTQARQIHDVLREGVGLSAAAQTNDGGWYYTPDSRNDEGSVTITQVQALRSCRNVGVAVPKTAIDKAMNYLVRSQNSDGGIRYALRQNAGNSRAPITAAAVCCWYNAGEYDNPRAKKALAFAKEKIKPRGTQGGHDFYAHFYMAQALYVSSDPDWDDYFAKRRDYLLGQQRPDGSWFGDGVGDAYGTAIALIILQLPYNQLPIMQR